MVSFNWERALLLLLVFVTILQMADAHLLCRIEIDSARGLWRDVTPLQLISVCTDYSYRETRLNCTSSRCPPETPLNKDCNVYHNADTYWPCLATCKEGCPNGLSCSGLKTCPCTQGVARYQGKMCVPYNGVKICTAGQVYAQGQCLQPDLIDDCPNGDDDRAGTCKCKHGFSEDPKTGKCVIHDCLAKCLDGTCHVYGDCTCNKGFYKRDPSYIYNCVWQSTCSISECKNGWCENGKCLCYEGFKNDPGNQYRCVPINCPASDHDTKRVNFCKKVCQASSCGRENGVCDQGECKCRFGFKKSSSEDKCEAIQCPDESEVNYCLELCHGRCVKDGQCSKDGQCRCNQGYKTDHSDNYVCSKIKCPSSPHQEDTYCKTKCDTDCQHGVCDSQGNCKCDSGFKNVSDELYECVKIDCPAKSPSDLDFCLSQCNVACKNGKCDVGGNCQCNEGFVSTNLTTNVSCHLECHEDGSCHRIAWIGIVGGVCLTVVVAVVVAVRKRKPVATARTEQVEEMQEVPAATQVEEREYANYDAQEGEMEENSLYQSWGTQPGTRRVL